MISLQCFVDKFADLAATIDVVLRRFGVENVVEREGFSGGGVIIDAADLSPILVNLEQVIVISPVDLVLEEGPDSDGDLDPCSFHNIFMYKGGGVVIGHLGE